MDDKSRRIVHLIIAMIVLPGTAVVLIPGLLIWNNGIELPHPTTVSYWLAKVLLPGGLVIAGWTVASFFVQGKGTPAPWQPPKRLVVSGAYAYVRNPMLIGVLMFLAGEALLLSSRPIGLWAALFFALNTAYFIFFEEPALERRFGDDYRLYKQHVRRWLPRLSAWTPPWPTVRPTDEDDQDDTDKGDPWQGYDPNRTQPPKKD